MLFCGYALVFFIFGQIITLASQILLITLIPALIVQKSYVLQYHTASDEHEADLISY